MRSSSSFCPLFFARPASVLQTHSAFLPPLPGSPTPHPPAAHHSSQILTPTLTPTPPATHRSSQIQGRARARFAKACQAGGLMRHSGSGPPSRCRRCSARPRSWLHLRPRHLRRQRSAVQRSCRRVSLQQNRIKKEGGGAPFYLEPRHARLIVDVAHEPVEQDLGRRVRTELLGVVLRVLVVPHPHEL